MEQSSDVIAVGYEAIPFRATPERAEIVSKLIRGICGFDEVFSDGVQACSERCFQGKELGEFCPGCAARMTLVSRALLKPDSRVWEVWSSEPELVGVIYVTDVLPGMDAVGHYIFFDRDLRGKTGVLKEVIRWLFTDSDDWKGLRRLTIEIPDFAGALAKHAHKRLGFSGDFRTKLLDGTELKVEGVKRNALVWRGKPRGLIYMGLVNPTGSTPPEPIDSRPQ